MIKELFPANTESRNSKKAFNWLLVGVLLGVFFTLIVGIHYLDSGFDKNTGNWLFSLMTPSSIKVFGIISDLGDVRLIFPSTLVLLVYFGWQLKWNFVAGLAYCVYGGGAISSFLKFIFQRPQIDLWQPSSLAVDFGFPSGHTILSILFYGYIAYILIKSTQNRKWRWVLGISASLLSLLIGISRLLIGVHLPSEVAGGWVFGMFWLLISIAISSKTEKTLTPKKMIGLN